MIAEELGDYYQRLKMVIEKAYADADGGKVVLIGHSLGNFVALHFLARLVDQVKKPPAVGFT